MKVCPKCGHREADRICTACGRRIGTSEKYRKTGPDAPRHWDCEDPQGYGGMDWKERVAFVQRIRPDKRTWPCTDC